MISFSWYHAWSSASFGVKCVMMVLWSMSLLSWCYIVVLYNQFKLKDKLFADALDICERHDSYRSLQTQSFVSKSGILVQQLLRDGSVILKESKTNSWLELSQVLESKLHVSSQKYNKIAYKSWPLATVATISPFIGLLGTVLGVMNTLSVFGLKGNIDLSVLGPGVAEALFTTALGLIVAIPASLAFNAMVTWSNNIQVKSDLLLNNVNYYLWGVWQSYGQKK